MNWIKRAFRSISYHKKNTILMFLSFLILSILILFGLCIRARSFLFLIGFDVISIAASTFSSGVR